MQAPREQDSVASPPRLSLGRSELLLPRSDLRGEPGRRLPAHPLQFDERGFPIAQPPLPVAERLAGRLTRNRRRPER
jgi:hypothetical protein